MAITEIKEKIENFRFLNLGIFDLVQIEKKGWEIPNVISYHFDFQKGNKIFRNMKFFLGLLITRFRNFELKNTFGGGGGTAGI